MVDVVIAEEPWGPDFWRDAEALAVAHFEEVDGGVEPNRPMKLDISLMDTLRDVGMLKIITARSSGEMLGYLTWSVMRDVESEGLMIGEQGAWFVAPGHPRVAADLFEWSVVVLKALGVRCIFPHHREQGRGVNLGRFFEARGARKIKTVYSLWIGA